VGGGATAGDLDRATHEFGLATPSATVSTVGMAGFTLGGGIGHLVRAHGLAADNLIGAEVVLAGGRRVSVDEESEPELFWALRGGGGNFGVATELRYRLHPVRNVTGGPMLWALADTGEVLDLYLRWLPQQPNEVSAFLAIMVVPPADPFPEAIRLRPVCALVWCNTAAPEHANAALDTFRAAAPPPLLDAVAELPYPALQTAFDPIAEIGNHNHITGQCYSSLPAGAAIEFARFGETTPHWLSFTHLYPINGAAAPPRQQRHRLAMARRDIRADVPRLQQRARPRPRAPSMGTRVRRRAGSLRDWRGLLQLRHGRGTRRRPRLLSRQLRAARRDQSTLRPRQRLPYQPEHPAPTESCPVEPPIRNKDLTAP
jgi:FAD/FMN-containing dehydrogenase